MPYSQLPEATQQYIAQAQVNLTAWMHNSMQAVYLADLGLGTFRDPNFQYLAQPPYSNALGALVNTAHGLIDAIQGEYWNAAGSAFNVLASVMPHFLPFPNASTAWLAGMTLGQLSRAYTWTTHLNQAYQGFDIIRNFVHAVQVPKLRQYWNMYFNGYISKSELLAFSGARSMEHFYEVAGCDPAFAGPIMERRQNQQMTDAQLLDFMGLDNMQQVARVLGVQWRMSIELNDFFHENGANITFAQAEALTAAYLEDIRNIEDGTRVEFLVALGEKVGELGLNDMLSPDYVSSIINDAFEETRVSIAEEFGDENNTQGVAFSPETKGVLLSANAFIDAADQQAKKKTVTSDENSLNTNLIQSNIALVMRQLGKEPDSVGSFYKNVSDQSSFASLSFASPFENNALNKS